MSAVGPALQPIGVDQRLKAYLADLWRRRQFATAIAFGEARSQHMDSALGSLWLILNPAMLMGIYYVIFGLVLEVNRGVDNLIAFLAVGVFMFHYTQRSVVAGSKSVLKNEGLIRSIAFPRAILPIATVLAHTVMFLPAVAVMLAVALVTGEYPRGTWLLLPVVFVLQTLFNVGFALVVARLTSRFPDVQNVLPYVFRILFYLSGILFLATRYVSEAQLWLFDFNPIYALVTLTRGLIMDGTMHPWLWLSATVWALVALGGGFAFFKRGEREYGRG